MTPGEEAILERIASALERIADLLEPRQMLELAEPVIPDRVLEDGSGGGGAYPPPACERRPIGEGLECYGSGRDEFPL